MGGIRRLKRGMSKQIVLHKTGLTFGGEEVCLAVTGSDGAGKAAAFQRECLRNAHRSSLMNIGDILAVSGYVRSKLMAGEAIWN